MIAGRWLRLAAWITGGIIVVLALFIVVLHTPPARHYALRQVIALFKSQGITFDASQLDYNLLDLSAGLNDVVVRSPQAADLPPILRADHVKVELSLAKLLRGKYQLSDSVIQNPQLNLVIDSTGRDNIPRPPKKEQTGETDYLIDKLVITGGSVRFEDQRQKLVADLPLNQLVVDGNPVTNNHEIKLEAAGGGQISLENRTMPVRGLTAEVLVEKNAADLHRLDIRLGDSTVSLAGRVDSFDDPRFDLSANTRLALGSLVEFAGVKQTVRGNVDVALTAKGPIKDLEATARLRGDDLTIDRFTRLDVRAEAAYAAAQSRVRLDSLNVESPTGTIRGKADLALNSAAGQSTANLAAHNLNLAAVSRLMKLPVQIASQATAEIAARWPALEFEKAAGDATVRLAATRNTPARDVLPVSGSLNVKTHGERMVVGIPELRTMQATAAGQIVVTNQRNLGGELRVQAADISPVIHNTEAFLGKPAGTLIGTPVAGSAEITAKLGGTVQAPAASAAISAPALTAGTLEGIDVDAALQYDPNRLEISDARVQWREQALTASGTVGLKGADPSIELHARTENLTVESLLSALNRTDIPASGNIALTADVRGTTKRPQADVQLTATDLLAYQENFGTLAMQARVQDQVAVLNDLRLDKPQPGGDGSLRASGTYRLDTREYTVQAESSNLKLVSLTLPEAIPVRGNIDLKAQGQGTVDNPGLELKAAVRDLVIRDDQLGSVDLSAQVANRRAVIDADAPKFGLAAKADIATQAPYPATVEITAEKTDLASLPVDLGEPLTGTVTAAVRGTGDLNNPAAGQATAEVSSANVEWRGQPIQTEGPLRARYENRMLTVDQATILARDSRVSLKGTLPLDTTAGDGAINLSAKLDLASLADYIPSDQPVTAQGIAAIDGSIRGNLKRIDPNLTVAVDNGYISAANLDPPLSNITVRAEIRDGAVELRSASTDMGPATITASGTVPFGLLPADLPIELPRRQGPAQFTAELKTLELDTLEAVPDNIAGTISARLEVQAPRPEPEAIVGKLTFPDFRVAIGAYSLEQKGRPEILIQNGTVRVDEFLLTGPTTEVRLAGTAGFTGDRPLNVKLDGNLDASVVSAFSEAIRASGPTEIHLAVTGNMNQPQARGTVQLADAQVSVETPRIGIDNLNARLDLDGRRLTISQLTGSLNGGTLSGQGSAEYTNGQLQNTNLAVKADEVFLDFPQGLKTVSNIALNLQNTANEGLVLGGQVSITEGGFTDDLNIERGVLAALTAPRGIEVTKDRNPMLEKLALSVGVRTESPIIVDNNLAEAEISADLRVVGNPYDTGLSGRLIIEEGGQLRLQERKYIIERGVITFANERRIVPSLDVLATTRAGGYDIRLQISGEPGKTQTTLTSDPELPEPDILAVLVTGKTMEQMRGEEFTVASNQVLSYLAGRVGSTLGRGIESATGISTVRIEPTLIAAEADPSARLTVGQNITRNLQLIYSMDLVDSSDQIYVAEYELSRRFTTNAIRQSDGTFRLEFRHDLRFGGIPEPRRGARREHRRIGNISILGDPLILPEPKIADKLDIEQGDRYDFFKIRRGVDRISQLYAKADLLEARVRMNREQRDSTVDLNLNVAAGPKVEFVFEGISPKAAGEDRVREVWRSGVFDVQRAEDSVEAIKERLVKEDYLQPKIKYSISTPAPDLKRVLFDIQPGPKYSDVEWAFPGAKGIEPGDLRKVIKQQKLSTEVYTKPGRVTEMLARFYQEHGYLDAEVSDPQYELNPQGGSGKVIFEVTEGPLFRIAKVAFEGNNAFPDASLAEAVPLPTGEPYRPILREHALQRLRDLYWEQGYNDVEAEMVLARSEESGTADITFQITENKQAIVREILIEGNQNTSENMIRTQLEVTPGAALNLQKLADSRRNLYFTGAYSIVDIVREDITGAETNGNDKPVRLRVKVREVQPFELRYGGYFDTERGPGAIVDISNRNSLGSARVLGLRTRYDKQLQEARLYFSQPLLKRFPLKTIVSPYVRYERNPATPDADPFNVDRVGFSIQQETTFWEKFLLNYGYRIERSRTYDPGPEAFFDIPLRIASLTSSLSRDTRDELLDASRGSFMSQAIQYSPELLGSELRFIKYLGQYFKYIPLQKPRIELFTNKVMRPRLVYAGGIRVGLSTGLGDQEVPLSERFLAGGATTIRGFEQNSIGPAAGRVQLGGEGMLVINNELRVPLFSIFDGVGFVDVGNVYRTVSDFSFGDIRKTAGVGLRARTPWFLLRLDYGLKLDRRTGETSGRLYFSIGQAF